MTESDFVYTKKVTIIEGIIFYNFIMIQKILSTFLISIILFSTHTFAAYTDKDLILTRAELGQYSPYASQFDILIPRLSTERLEEIEGKLSASIGKIEGEK